MWQWLTTTDSMPVIVMLAIFAVLIGVRIGAGFRMSSPAAYRRQLRSLEKLDKIEADIHSLLQQKNVKRITIKRREKK